MTTVTAPALAGRMSGGPVNGTVLRLTLRAMLGRRRGVLLIVLPFVLLTLAGVVHGIVGTKTGPADSLLSSFAMAVLVPLVALIAGTGAIGPEIDDGSIVYLLGKPVRRGTVVLSKALAAVAVTALFGAVPVGLAGLILAGTGHGLALGYAVGALCAGTAYAALFVMLGVVSRHAVVFGLIYVLLWEGLLGGLIGGARVLSVGQWGVSVASSAAADGAVTAHVGLVTAVVLLVVVTTAALWWASNRLARLRLTGEE